jgi:hypothetical protein
LRRERDAAAQTAEIRTDPVESPPGDPSLAPGPRSNLRWAAAAAVLLLCAGVAAWLFIGRKNEPVPLNCKATLALKELDSAEAAFERGRACLDISPCDGIDLMAHAGYRDVPGALLAAAEHLDPRLRPADLPCKEPTASALVMYRYLIEDGVESPDDEKATLAIAQIRAFLTEKAAAGDAAAERDLKENF